MHIIGIDIGGTFTDCTVISPDGRVTIVKSPSTPPDFETGFVDAIRAGAAALGLSAEELVGGTRGIYHGCTVGTNALVEGRTARTALLTTRGHRDSIFFMQSGRRLRGLPAEALAHVARHEKPEPLVPKSLVGEIDERVAFDGAAVVELNERTAREAIERLLEQGVDAFAVSLLWSIANPAHEQRVAELVRELAPDAYVSVASEIVARTGEYERTVATVINALVGPAMHAYLAAVEHRLAALGYRAPLQVMTCGGGLITADEARRLPVLTIGSGPVAGVIGSLSLAGVSGEARATEAIITADMGGTTLDVGVIRRGAPLTRATTWHGQYEYFVPTVDVRSIGSGGGSIVHHDEAEGTLRVGPQSAGARPGPACYGRGGTRATISDADLVLGYLNPANFVAGAMTLDAAAARRALADAGAALGFDAEETAAAAVRIVTHQMADAIRLASVQQGFDPREFTLYAYGGAGPIHGAALARELGMPRMVVPLSDLASGWSAFGVAGSEALVIEEQAVSMRHPFDPDALTELWEALEERVSERMRAQGIGGDGVRYERFADMRYPLQVNQIQVAAPGGRYDDGTVDRLIANYEREYARVFGEGTGYADAGYALTGMRVKGRAPISDFRLTARRPATGQPSADSARDVTFVGAEVRVERVPVYDGTDMAPGACVTGPALIELPNTSVVLPPDSSGSVDRLGSLIVEL